MKSNKKSELSKVEKEDLILKWIRKDLNREEIFIGFPFVQRFLRARKYKVDKAKKMLTNYFKFRDKMLKKMDYFKKNNSNGN